MLTRGDYSSSVSTAAVEETLRVVSLSIELYRVSFGNAVLNHSSDGTCLNTDPRLDPFKEVTFIGIHIISLKVRVRVRVYAQQDFCLWWGFDTKKSPPRQSNRHHATEKPTNVTIARSSALPSMHRRCLSRAHLHDTSKSKTTVPPVPQRTPGVYE